MPTAPWIMYQQWSDLLFAHWIVDPQIIRKLVPEQLELDTFGGNAYVAVTPFRMTELGFRGLEPIPGTSPFLEMNFRTYVRMPGKKGERDPFDHVSKPGVYFFSLDASNLPAVMGARVGLGLPYFHADMGAREEDGWMHYQSTRKSNGAHVEVRYRRSGMIPRKTALEQFLTERYCLYEVRAGQAMRTEIQHVEWPLEHAEAQFKAVTVGGFHGVPLTAKPDLLHFSKVIDVVVYPPELARE